mmetsp:Transcript_705/g.1276  ORF Transcript_705/g.1276 Transcript_705/m.1276 type:complete len:276 (-) Transcript_705:639-1466(-)
MCLRCASCSSRSRCWFFFFSSLTLSNITMSPLYELNSLRWKCKTSVTTALRKCLSWLTIKSVPLNSLFRYLSSQRTASRSRWFVGSSSSRRSGEAKSAQARLTLILQPPLSLEVGESALESPKPSPARTFRARGSGAPDISSIMASLEYALARASAFPPPSSASHLATNFCSAALLESLASTVSRAVIDPPMISCLTRSRLVLRGMPWISLPASISMSVVLPQPLRPTRPYLLPLASVRLTFDSRSCPLPFLLGRLKFVRWTSAALSSASKSAPS